MSTILPPKAHAAAAQLEDALTTWRTGTRPHARTRAAGVRAIELCGVIEVEISSLQREIQRGVELYDRSQRHGEGLDALTDHQSYVDAAEQRHVDTVDPRTIRGLDDAIGSLDEVIVGLRDLRGHLRAG